MDVDASAKRVAVLGLQAFEPNNSRHNRIAPGRIRPENFSGSTTTPEDSTKRSARPNLLCHLHASQRSCAASRSIAQSEFRRGNEESANQSRFVVKLHALIGYADQDSVITISCCASRE
jgi:hypothetical protein